MSGHGVFAVARGLWEDGDFADEPCTEREAFIWLLGAAAWKPLKVRSNGVPVAINRGEFCFSIRFLAKRWQWSKSRVARFLKRLENRDIVRDSARDGAQVYSIKNYNRFQVVGMPEWDSDRDDQRDKSGTSPGQVRDKEETGETGNSSSSLRSDEPRADLAREFDTTFWPAYPHKVGKPKARDAFLKARRRTPLDAIMAGLQRYVATKPSDRSWMNPATFLNGERWNDEPAPDSNAVRPSGQRASGPDALVAAMGDTFGSGGERAAGPPSAFAEPVPPDRRAAEDYPGPCIDAEPKPDGWTVGDGGQDDHDAVAGLPGGSDERSGGESEGGGISDCAGRSAGMGGREGVPGMAAPREPGRAGQPGFRAEPAAIASAGDAPCRAGNDRIPELAVVAGGRGRA